ncbi:MAG: YlmC/YmxH family sporulation protein [Clostridia bacterium]|nr:YlmC/YmxH family sporulation protein [Clostridia bacterium]
MRITSFNELKQKEVINICDGRRLGYVCNAEIEIPCGQIVSISVPADCKCFSFGKVEEIRIPWCNIERIGADTVIVKADFIPAPHDKK